MSPGSEVLTTLNHLPVTGSWNLGRPGLMVTKHPTLLSGYPRHGEIFLVPHNRMRSNFRFWKWKWRHPRWRTEGGPKRGTKNLPTLLLAKHHPKHCRVIVNWNGPLGRYLSEISIEIQNFLSKNYSLQNVVCKIVTNLSRPQCFNTFASVPVKGPNGHTA